MHDPICLNKTNKMNYIQNYSQILIHRIYHYVNLNSISNDPTQSLLILPLSESDRNCNVLKYLNCWSKISLRANLENIGMFRWFKWFDYRWSYDRQPETSKVYQLDQQTWISECFSIEHSISFYIALWHANM